MDHTRYSRLTLLAAAFWIAAAFGVRTLLLHTSFTAEGILLRNSHALTWTVCFSLAGFLLLGFFSMRLNRLPGTDNCLRCELPGQLPGLAAAALLLLGCLLRLTGGTLGDDTALRAAELVGLLAAVLLGVTALYRDRLGPNGFWTLLPAALYACGSLVLHFRGWSQDPMIIDIFPLLLARICSMLCFVLLLGFPLNVGHRRSSVLWGLLAGIFTAMTAPDYLFGFREDLPELFIQLGLGLWCVTCAMLVLRPAVQEETAPDPEPEAPAEAPQEEQSGEESGNHA